MSDLVTITAENIDTIHSCTPTEYIKRANARDLRIIEAMKLKRFVAFLMPRIGHIEDIPAEDLDRLLGEYLDGMETRIR